MAFYLTKEDGDKILQETGDGLLLENQSSPSASISPSASYSPSSSISASPSPGASPTVVLNSPADASDTKDTTPTFNFTGTDPEGHTLEYEIQIDTVNTFDSQ